MNILCLRASYLTTIALVTSPSVRQGAIIDNPVLLSPLILTVNRISQTLIMAVHAPYRRGTIRSLPAGGDESFECKATLTLTHAAEPLLRWFALIIATVQMPEADCHVQGDLLYQCTSCQDPTIVDPPSAQRRILQVLA